MGWPTVAEFQVFLTAAGIMASTPTDLQLLLDLDGALDAAVEEFNDRTRYWPFLSTGIDEARRFIGDPLAPRYLDLNGGLLTLTSLITNVTYTNSAGTLETQTLNFRLCPRDAVQRGRPYTYVEFLSDPAYVDDGEVLITGTWGFTTAANLPDSARRAVMAIASITLLPQINQAATQGLLRWREGDVEKQFGKAAEMAGTWGLIADQAINRYRRTRVA